MDQDPAAATTDAATTTSSKALSHQHDPQQDRSHHPRGRHPGIPRRRAAGHHPRRTRRPPQRHQQTGPPMEPSAIGGPPPPRRTAGGSGGERRGDGRELRPEADSPLVSPGAATWGKGCLIATYASNSSTATPQGKATALTQATEKATSPVEYGTQRQLLACSVEKGKGGKPGKPQQPSRNLGEVDKGEAKAPGSLSGHADTGAGGVHRSSDAHLCAAPAAGSAGGQAAGDAGMLHAPEAAAPANVRRDVRPHVHPAHHGHHGVKEVRVFAVRSALALLPDQVLFLHALGARKVASYFFTFVRLEFP
ncbi:hypothetical protein ZWY2020_013605 [Hordeum vulgare]|nr:hypothetical protein ZWY2020_013605 [Hordeum vulgare]